MKGGEEKGAIVYCGRHSKKKAERFFPSF